MQLVGRALQIIGLIVPPLAIALQVANVISVKHLLGFAVLAIAGFYLGRLIEGHSRP